MCHNLLRGISFWFAFLAGLALVSTAVAQTTDGGGQPSQADAIKALRSAHKLLVEADRDYEGHRAKAAEEVHKALRDLGYRHKKPQPGSPPANGTAAPKTHSGQPAVHEPQATSDAQLRQAQEILQGLSKQLGSNHPKAAANVKAAIGEITMALSIR